MRTCSRSKFCQVGISLGLKPMRWLEFEMTGNILTLSVDDKIADLCDAEASRLNN
jgi:hypothetical protein